MAQWCLLPTGKIIRFPNTTIEECERRGDSFETQYGVVKMLPCDNTMDPVKDLRQHYRVNRIILEVGLEAKRNAELNAFSLRPSSAHSDIGGTPPFRSTTSFR